MPEQKKKQKNSSLKTSKSASGTATASLVLSLIFFIPIVPQILAIIFGISALNRMTKDNTDGKGLAIAGLVVGIIFLVFWIFIIFMFAIFAASLIPFYAV